jgi:hypothetical protein
MADYPNSTPLPESEILNRAFDPDTDTLKTSGGGSSTAGAVDNGTKTVTTSGTAEQLAADTECTSVAITPLSTNTGIIYVGGPNVNAATENGFPLDSGISIVISTDNLNDVWIDAAVSGEGVAFIYTKEA